jgi:hypothetical protein
MYGEKLRKLDVLDFSSPAPETLRILNCLNSVSLHYFPVYSTYISSIAYFHRPLSLSAVRTLYSILSDNCLVS